MYPYVQFYYKYNKYINYILGYRILVVQQTLTLLDQVRILVAQPRVPVFFIYI